MELEEAAVHRAWRATSIPTEALAQGRNVEVPLRQGLPSVQLRVQLHRGAGVKTHYSGVPKTPKGLCS